MITLTELKNIKSPHMLNYEKNKTRSHVYYDPQNFSYKFMKCRYENKHRVFSHVEISEFIFEDISEEKANEMINQAINTLDTTNDCWCSIEPSNNLRKIECENCKSLK